MVTGRSSDGRPRVCAEQLSMVMQMHVRRSAQRASAARPPVRCPPHHCNTWTPERFPGGRPSQAGPSAILGPGRGRQDAGHGLRATDPAHCGITPAPAPDSLLLCYLAAGGQGHCLTVCHQQHSRSPSVCHLMCYPPVAWQYSLPYLKPVHVSIKVHFHVPTGPHALLMGSTSCHHLLSRCLP